MIHFDSRIEEILLERERIAEKLRDLEKNKAVRKYLQLLEDDRELQSYQVQVYMEAKKMEFETCDHIWIEIGKNDDEHPLFGCIKCGLDERMFCAKKDLLWTEKLIYDFMCTHNYFNGNVTKLSCNFELVCAIYKKIMEYYPLIDDKTALRYLFVSLNDMNNIQVTDARKTSRAKRLSLNPNFNGWESQLK